MSHLVQSAALGVQNFVSAATGMAVLIPLIRGFMRKQSETIGNFWVDLTRSTLYILLPLSIVMAVFLVTRACRRPPTARRPRRCSMPSPAHRRPMPGQGRWSRR